MYEKIKINSKASDRQIEYDIAKSIKCYKKMGYDYFYIEAKLKSILNKIKLKK